MLSCEKYVPLSAQISNPFLRANPLRVSHVLCLQLLTSCVLAGRAANERSAQYVTAKEIAHMFRVVDAQRNEMQGWRVYLWPTYFNETLNTPSICKALLHRP